MNIDLVNGADIRGLHPCMRAVMRKAGETWWEHGQPLVITCGLNGEHSAASWHYYGLALDFRTNFFDDRTITLVYETLKKDLPDYDVILHDTHIHVEIGNALAERLGVLY